MGRETNPQKCLDAVRKEVDPTSVTNILDAPGPNQINTVCCQSGRPDIKHILYFVKWIHPVILKADVKEVMSEHKECQSIDLASMYWPKDKLNGIDAWNWLWMNTAY